MPYFAEIPYYLWGHVNYDSEGNCRRPRDRGWSELLLENRDTSAVAEIRRCDGDWCIEGDEDISKGVAAFLAERSGATSSSTSLAPVSDSRHVEGLRRAALVAANFDNDALEPFDSHLFWGSWKWIGWFATEFTWVGRWIMHSVIRRDARAVPLCIEWLKAPPLPGQVDALCYALTILTGEHFKSPAEWVSWYEGGFFRTGAKSKYPAPDIGAWHVELKAEFDNLVV